MAIRSFSTVAALLVIGVSGSAQQQQCTIIPGDLFKPIVKPPDQVLKKPSDYFLLSLSWSPQFCTTSAGKASQNKFQCRENAFGFVVHGFWPQAADAQNTHDHPRNCQPTTPIAAQTLKEFLCLIPGIQLMQDEWAKHGTCAYDTPEKYFSTIEGVVGKLHLPDLGSMTSSKGVPARNLLKAFTDINAGLQASEMQLTLTGKNLSEVHICFDNNLAFRECDPGADPGDPRKVVIRKPL